MILIAGVNGSGKTTSIAKLSQRLKDEGRSILLAACDTFRAAAADQLAIWRSGRGRTLCGAIRAPIRRASHTMLATVPWRGIEVLIVDTAGRLHTQEHLMRELEKVRNVLARRSRRAP